MILKSLKLRNFGSHRSLDLELNTGVTGIVGGNGSGKSTVVTAISFLITGYTELTKEQMIIVGEATGYVAGSFELNGKEGYLERHLDTSKVILKYDGKEYKKAGEVKEVWDKLLQINPEIFNNLIIAKQGEIPLLFSGNKTIRLGIFQKIFLVPNVSKLKDTIWDYIKELPPVYNIEDTKSLQEEYILQSSDFDINTELYSQYTDISISSITTIDKEISKSEVLILNINKVNRLIAEADLLSLEIEEVTKIVTNTQTEVNEFPYTKPQLEEAIMEATLSKKKHQDKRIVEEELASLVAIHKKITFSETDESRLVTVQSSKEELDSKVSLELVAVNELNTSIEKYSDLKGEPVCPTCGQSIEDIKSMVNKLTEEKSQHLRTYQQLVSDRKIAENELSILISNKRHFVDSETSLKFKREELEKYSDVSYDQEEHELLTQAIQKLNKTEQSLTTYQSKQLQLKTKLSYLQIQLNSIELPTADIHDKIEELKAQKQKLELDLERKNTLHTQIQVLKSQISNLKERLTQANQNKLKNQKREKLYDLLIKLYDVFHPTTFSKKVIQKYSSVVTEYLLQNLSKFNIPYTAEIDDDFNVKVINKDGLVLPKVSGGQELIIGLCLRLALLQIFAQNLPLMILDEATHGLDLGNQEIYFQLVKDLNQTGLKQVLIVDHNERLLSVVDNQINLNER